MTLARCGAELSAIASRLEHQYPDSYPKGLGYAMRTAPLREELVHGARPMLLVLLVMAGIVLLVAYANVANLIHARMLRRELEPGDRAPLLASA